MKKDIEKEKTKRNNKKKFIGVLVVIIIVFIICLFYQDKEPLFEGEPWDKQLHINNNESSSDETIITGYSEVVLTETQPCIPLVNDERNTVNMKFHIYEGDNELYTTKYVAPSNVVNANIRNKLGGGTHTITIFIETFDIETNEPANQSSLSIVARVS